MPARRRRIWHGVMRCAIRSMCDCCKAMQGTVIAESCSCSSAPTGTLQPSWDPLHHPHVGSSVEECSHIEYNLHTCLLPLFDMDMGLTWTGTRRVGGCRSRE